MIRLRILGSTELKDADGRDLRTVLAQPKRLALLSYLAAMRGFHRRDTLLALFWPELDSTHSREALKQAVRFLRKELGGSPASVILGRGAGELGVQAGALWCDAAAFREHFDAKRYGEALDLYRGDLLPGLFSEQSAGFEDWMERERARLRAAAARAAREVAETRERDQSYTTAVIAARRAVELAGLDERAVRDLLGLLDRLGDRAGAIHAYDEFAQRLARELEVEPATETKDVVEEIRQRAVARSMAASEPTSLIASPTTAASGDWASGADLAPGAEVGPWRIVRELGSGGMATVYMALDVKHDRRVALKLLRADFTGLVGTDRFLREIQITSQLAHPHIVPLLDSGSHNGLPYLVTPYVAGESLRARLDREKKLPTADALRLAGEIAEALDYAHRCGIVHRDIKPENILLADGHAMVADFGIARAITVASAPRDNKATTTGVVIGSPSYMSPEALRGESVGVQTDIYALGCVIVEMLSGGLPNREETPSSLMRRQGFISPDVAKLVADCIAVSVEHRPQSAAVLARRLESVSRDPSPVVRKTTAQRNLLISGLSAALLVFGGIELRSRLVQQARDAVVRFQIEIPRFVTAGRPNGGIAVSPDGRTVAYIAGAADAAPQQIMLRRIGDFRSYPLAGTERAQSLFFAPDGKAIGYWTKGRVDRLSLEGGSPLVLLERVRSDGQCWTVKRMIVFATINHLQMLPDTGGPPIPVRGGSPGEQEVSPVCLDDGETVLVSTVTRSPTYRSTLTAVSLSTGKRTPLGVDGRAAVGLVDDALLYATGGQLMAVAFDRRRLATRGTPVQVATIARTEIPAVSANGTLVYAVGATAAELVRVDMRGVTHVFDTPPRVYGNPRFSPDGKRLAFSIGEGGESRVWLYDVAARTSLQFTDMPSDRPEWSPESRRVIFRRNAARNSRGEFTSLWWRPVDGSEAPTAAFADRNTELWEGVMTPDGRGMVVQRDNAATAPGGDILYRALSDTEFSEISATPNEETQARPSPDGKWVAFQSVAVGGTSQVVVKSISGRGASTVVSPGFGTEPLWSRDGKHLYYRDGQQFVDVEYASTPDFRILSRRPLFADGYLFSSQPHANYDVYPDGSGFIALRPLENRRLIVAYNWRAELRAKLAAAGRQ